ncbi:hypothetical protein F5878DRAFT_626076 [Lentinula raphanica]|uniref:Uncharacterized protein n=1 Tax=Lentinula raphanica TaxID=153919 RepID=A0AA38P4E7_9AGAR|nr:hypothetical protein F5878DRAFT_626076 [Lentinula raphanica]
MYLPLPNELLHSIIEFIIYTPRLPRALRSSFQRPPPELLALSVANWQLRRACLPFLFAKIKISNNKDAKQLENHLALCAKFIKASFIGSYGITQVVEEHIISQILPQLEQLLEVELGRCSKHTDLLKALLAHPSVTSVLVDEMPDESICNHDVSKMILDRSSLPSPADEKYFDRGMRLKRLSLDVDSDSIDDELETVNFPGVETIEIDMYDNLVSFSWLSRFSSKHPTLNEHWLLEIEDSDLFTHDESPFLALAQEYQPPQGLHDPFTILEVGLHRAKPLGKSSQEWHVMELTLEINGRLFEQLSLLAFSFPKLEILTLDSDSAVYYLDSAVYDISDLSSVLARFSSRPRLKVVSLEHFAARLSFGPENEKLPIPPMPRVAHTTQGIEY